MLKIYQRPARLATGEFDDIVIGTSFVGGIDGTTHHIIRMYGHSLRISMKATNQVWLKAIWR